MQVSCTALAYARAFAIRIRRINPTEYTGRSGYASYVPAEAGDMFVAENRDAFGRRRYVPSFRVRICHTFYAGLFGRYLGEDRLKMSD